MDSMVGTRLVLVIDGVGGGDPQSPESVYNYGVLVYQGGNISATGNGSVHVDGTGGNGGGHLNNGVLIQEVSKDGVGSSITVADGNLTVEGHGGSSGGSVASVYSVW